MCEFARRARRLIPPVFLLILGGCDLVWWAGPAQAQTQQGEACQRPSPGSQVPEPDDVYSENGILNVDLTLRNDVSSSGQVRYCYVTPEGKQSPTLRLRPGDLLVLHLKNALKDTSTAPTNAARTGHHDEGNKSGSDPCARAEMTALTTNLHFHGLEVPPVCHGDEVLRTSIDPSDPPFEYRVRIPKDQPPGLYWYHPHIHGFTESKLLGGASGALIVQGMEQANPKLAGLPERVFIIRDQPLLNPDAKPVQSGSMPAPMVMRDAEGDILNAGTDGGMPAKDLSINQVPVNFPEYQPAVIRMKPSERQLWRVLNAGADTYLDLQVVFNNTPQMLGVVALDGVPISSADAAERTRILWASHLLVPPAGRVEFIVSGPALGVQASFVTRKVDTGRDGENDPTRPLAQMVASAEAPEPRAKLTTTSGPAIAESEPWLGTVKPTRERKLYFAEKPQDPANAKSPIVYSINEDGRAPAPFDPTSKNPDITVQQGDVEDWIIENRTRELHAFHIHQTHFLLLEWNGVPLDEPYLRDTVNVPYWDGKSADYPSVKLRIDFRNANIVGTFLYHCHILEHEDGGMMGSIRVAARAATR
jgi:FtsP/CotA-like multicopper oxidase with cupredoxin domain